MPIGRQTRSIRETEVRLQFPPLYEPTKTANWKESYWRTVNNPSQKVTRLRPLSQTRLSSLFFDRSLIRAVSLARRDIYGLPTSWMSIIGVRHWLCTPILDTKITAYMRMHSVALTVLYGRPKQDAKRGGHIQLSVSWTPITHAFDYLLVFSSPLFKRVCVNFLPFLGTPGWVELS